MTKILYEPAGRIHPSQWELINNPPSGYEFIIQETAFDRGIVGNSFLFDKVRLQVLDRLMPLNLAKAWLDARLRRVPDDVGLVYAYNHIVPRKIPWVVNVEWANVLVGRDIGQFKRFKGIAERSLSSPMCKAIFVWTDVARKSMLLNYGCAGFVEKIHVVPPAVSTKDYTRNYDRNRVRLLFIGSPNDPNDFIAKGGFAVLEAFCHLAHEYDNLDLTMRAFIPQTIQTRHDGRLRVIREVLTQEQMDDEFRNADIFVFPSHLFHNTVVLEAMSWGLPVLTSYIGSSAGEYVEDGKTGIVVGDRHDAPYFIGNFMLATETIHRHWLVREAGKSQNKLTCDLMAKLRLLVGNPDLRRRLGEAGRQEVESGKFSIGRRNARLKSIFDEVIYG